MLLSRKLILIRKYAYHFNNSMKINQWNNFWINELSTFLFVLFRYRILFFYFFPVARTLTLWGAEMLNTFELNQKILQTFRSVPSALLPYAQGYERTRIPLNKIKAIFKLPENCSILEILKTSLHSNPLRFVKTWAFLDHIEEH